nr:FG-GAP repeat protein [Ferrimonas futtsuensis]
MALVCCIATAISPAKAVVIQQEAGELRPPVAGETTRFGGSIAVDGNLVLVGDIFAGERAGAAYLIKRDDDGSWQWQAKLEQPAGDDEVYFGTSVALDGDRVLIGVSTAEGMGLDTGVAYLFERNAIGHWVLVATLAADNGGPFELLGGRLPSAVTTPPSAPSVPMTMVKGRGLSTCLSAMVKERGSRSGGLSPMMVDRRTGLARRWRCPGTGCWLAPQAGCRRDPGRCI